MNTVKLIIATNKFFFLFKTDENYWEGTKILSNLYEKEKKKRSFTFTFTFMMAVRFVMRTKRLSGKEFRVFLSGKFYK